MIFILRIDDPNEGSDFAKYVFQVVDRLGKVDVARKVPYVEVEE